MYARMLVPLDGSQFAEAALQHVKAVAEGRRVDKVVLVRVVEPLIIDVKDYLGAERMREAEERLESSAKSYLEGAAAVLRNAGITADTRVVVDGEPAEKILETARQEKAELIVMSTHGRTGFKRWVFGSVANRVLVHSPVPVLMVVPEGRESHSGTR